MWVYKGQPITSHDDLLPGCTDIVYWITYTSGQFYIGKKAVRAMRKYPPLKGKKRVRRKLKDLPFLNYEGSHAKAGALEVASKEILYQCSTRKASTFLEAAVLFYHDVLSDPNGLNENIVGKFFAKDLDGLIE